VGFISFFKWALKKKTGGFFESSFLTTTLSGTQIHKWCVLCSLSQTESVALQSFVLVMQELPWKPESWKLPSVGRYTFQVQRFRCEDEYQHSLSLRPLRSISCKLWGFKQDWLI